MTHEPRGWRRRTAAWAVGAVVSGLLIAAVLWWADPDQVWAAARRARPRWLAFASACFAAVAFLRWGRVVLLAHDRSRPLALLGVASGHALLNKVMPLRTGELAFPVLYRRATGASLRGGLVLLAALRVSELACLLPLYAAACFWYWGAASPPVVVAAALGGVTVQLALPWALGRLGRLAILARAHEELRSLSRRRLLALAGVNVCVWLGLFAMYYCVLEAFAAGVAPAQAVVGAGGAIVTNLLPINGLGSIGTMEAGWTAGLTATGAEAGPVITAGLTMHAITIVGNLPFAAAGLVGLRRVPAPTAAVEPPA